MAARMSTKIVKLSKLTTRVKFPDKFKGTIVERWANFWKNLYLDYVQMLKDIRTDSQDNPKKALYYVGGLSAVLALAKNNPTEADFKEELKKYSNEIILVGEETRNPYSYEHLSRMQRYYNEGVMRNISLGVVSFMYKSDFSQKTSLYKSQCKYTTPTYLSFPSRIVDIGFMGRWWNIFIKTCDYDVNPHEVINHPN